MITTLSDIPASRLGLAAYPEQDPRCVQKAHRGGVNYFFFYGPSNQHFIKALAPIMRKHRKDVIVATGSGSRKATTLRTARRKALAALNTDYIDVYFAEYINKADDPSLIFGDSGVLDELQQWKAEGLIRYVGVTAHDRQIARRLAEDPRVDVLMHRFNMAHRKASREVFPSAVKSKTPVVAFTATRWGTLLERHELWTGEPPSAADCYRFCLAQSAVKIVLCAPVSSRELTEDLQVLKSRSMSNKEIAHWERFGDLVHGIGNDQFETMWP